MIDTIKQLCKQHVKSIESAHLITIHQLFSNHCDFLTVNFILDALIKGNDVTFLAIRENYAHYLALSKKMGKSIEQFGKNGKLKYYECFGSEICSELPLTQSSPATYVRPPKFVNVVNISSLQRIQVKQYSLFVIDALSFIEYTPSLCYKLYQEGINKKCRMIFGGCLNGAVSEVLGRQASFNIQLQNDVGGYGKFKLIEQNCETSLLWKWIQGKFQVSKYMKM